MTRPFIDDLLMAARKATPGDWTVWAEKTPTREDAIRELTEQVNSTTDEGFCGETYLINADGKCPALTGCGPTSRANAAYIALADPSTIIELCEYVKELEEALKPFAKEGNEWGRTHGDAYKFTLGDLRRARATLEKMK